VAVMVVRRASYGLLRSNDIVRYRNWIKRRMAISGNVHSVF
jgi:hypothetical protein